MNEAILLQDIRARLSDHRYEHSLQVAKTAVELADRYGGDREQMRLAGLMHDVLKEQPKDEALAFFAAHGVTLTPVERSAPKLWHAMAGAIYLKETYDFPDGIVTAVRYHTTGRENMTLGEKILFIADFISADRDYPGVDDMRERAKVSLEYAMEEGLRFTIYELSEKCRPIHPDTVACYNQIVLLRPKNSFLAK
ncbi:MAG: bis(5'-nucleosyl)-tetraphosphatase (symmetrical) YqeK [Clostridia bacterium]|nr:bis(5'-nucleosyl)-tetraphosphatase (symmetrical) YqeK [Clostridia bacterium]